MSTNSNNLEPKEPWYKVLQSLATTASLVLVPVVIAFIGHNYSKEQSESKLSAEYIKMGVNILNAKPSDSNKNTRKWAVDLINHYSSVKIADETKEELTKNVSLQSFSLPNLDKIIEELNKVEFLFTWQGDENKGYEFEIQKYVTDDWVFFNGMSVLGNELILSIPRNVKLRWRTGTENDKTKKKEYTEWQELMIKK